MNAVSRTFQLQGRDSRELALVIYTGNPQSDQKRKPCVSTGLHPPPPFPTAIHSFLRLRSRAYPFSLFPTVTQRDNLYYFLSILLLSLFFALTPLWLAPLLFILPVLSALLSFFCCELPFLSPVCAYSSCAVAKNSNTQRMRAHRNVSSVLLIIGHITFHLSFTRKSYYSHDNLPISFDYENKFWTSKCSGILVKESI